MKWDYSDVSFEMAQSGCHLPEVHTAPSLSLFWLFRATSLGVTSCHKLHELHVPSACWSPAGSPGPSWDSAWKLSQHGSRGWVSALGFRRIMLLPLRHLIANERAQVTLLVLWAAVDCGDNMWHPDSPVSTESTWHLAGRHAGT